MAEWVKRRPKLQMLVGLVKDHLSTGMAMAKNGPLSQIDLAVLRATNHEERGIEEESIRSVLEIGTGSRMCVSHCIRVIMDRLNKTSNWVVALKCLIVIHRCLNDGGFMFQDQLSVRPVEGGHNYLNLSNFKDTSSPLAWAVSAWIRWYAQFIEQWIQSARSTRTLLDVKLVNTSPHSEMCKSAHAEKLLSLENRHLVQDVITFHDLLQEACAWQAEEEEVMRHVLVKQGLRLVVQVTLSVYQEITLRLYETQKRIATLKRSEATSLVHVCEKLLTESMALTHLSELVKDSPTQHDHVAAEQFIFTDYELMNLKQAFGLAAASNHRDDPVGSNSSKASEEVKHMSISGFPTLA